MLRRFNLKKTIDLTVGIADREKAHHVQRLQTDFETGSISRRGFMTGALALGVSMTAASALLNSAEAATPKKGGRARIGLTGGATSDTLDPGQILDLYMLNLQFGQLRNGLTEVASNGDLIPELAESWDSSTDAKVWTFKIRQGVEFSNGKSLTTEDVVDSLNHHLGEDSTSAAKGILSGVESVKADGNTVVVTLSGGDADFPFLMSDYHLNICPSKGDGSIDWESGVGTGGYVLVEHEPGVRTLTKRNPNYWKEGMAHFDEVEILQIADASARSNALRTDAIDGMNNVEVKTVERMKKVPGINIKATTGNKQITLPMHTDKAPYDDNNVRLAIKHIVDREEWLKKVVYGYGELGNDNPIGPANIYRATTDELPQRSYDPDKAKFYLKQAGLEKLSIQFHAADTGFGGAVDAGQLMRETARPAGIDIEVIREPDDGYWSNVWQKKPFCACYWSGRPTENWIFSQIYAADASWNDTNWKHEKFNKLLIQGRGELDTAKRREIYVEMQTIINEEGGVCLPLFQSDVMAYNDKLAVPEVVGNNWELDGGKFNERWWFS
ncbi:MAG: ABC transporter substrate-binding protein [Acidiferrobacterales bacterium]|nr:ABC transporter substrate-binding protein [Acidiferrobacterales bacterium]